MMKKYVIFISNLFVVLGLLFVCSSIVYSQTNAQASPATLPVSVMDLELKDANLQEAKTVTDFLKADLKHTGVFTVIENNKINIKFMITGTLSKLGAQYRLNLKAIDIEKGEVIITKDKQSRRLNDFSDVSKEITFDLLNVTGRATTASTVSESGQEHEITLKKRMRQNKTTDKIEITTEIQAGVRAENLITKGKAQKFLYREQSFDYYGEPFYQKNYFNIMPDIFFISGINFYNRYKFSTELEFDYFRNRYMLFTDKYAEENIELESYNWHPSIIGKNYMSSYLFKFDTLNDSDELNTTVSVGRIYPEYTPLTFKKRHNGLMLELFNDKNKFIVTGAQLQNFNNISKYLFSARFETEQLAIGKFGVTYLNSWYNVKRLEQFKNTPYYDSRESGGAAVYVRFKAKSLSTDTGSRLSRLRIDVTNNNNVGVVVDNFQPGDPAEQKYLFDVHGATDLDKNTRYANYNGYFIYRIIIPQDTKKIRLTFDVSGDYFVEYSFDNSRYQSLAANGNIVPQGAPVTVIKDIALLPDITADGQFVNLKIGYNGSDAGGEYAGDLYALEYYEDNQLIVSFSPSDQPDSEEQKYLVSGGIYRIDNALPHRFADSGPFTYRFPVKKGTKSIRFRVLVQNNYKVSAYLDGFEDQVVSIVEAGDVKDGSNKNYYDLVLDSYSDIYKNTYVSKSQSLIGFDYTTKILGTDIYFELDKLMDQRLYADKTTKTKDSYALLARVQKKFVKQKIKLNARYYKIDTEYNLNDFIDINLDDDQYIDELQPKLTKYKYYNYDPSLDPFNSQLFNVTLSDPIPVNYDNKVYYIYRWENTYPGYFTYDEQGYEASIEKDRLFNMFDMGLFYFNAKQLSMEEKKEKKIFYRFKFMEPFPQDSYIDNEYRIEYVKDSRDKSIYKNNLLNFVKFIYVYWGLKNVLLQFGMNQLAFNSDLDTQTSTLTSEFLTQIIYHFKITRSFTFDPMYMMKLLKQFRYNPDYVLNMEYVSHFLGCDVNYTILKDFGAYYVYRTIYIDDKPFPINNKFFHIMEIGLQHTGILFFKVGCSYTAQQYVPVASRVNNWEATRVFGEVRYYF